jgi:hypothetical protein
MQPLDPTFSGDAVQSGPQGVIGARPGKETAGQGTVIETGATHEEWEAAARVNLPDDPGGITGKRGGGVHLRRVSEINEVMPDSAALLDGQLVGADVEASVHRGGIAVDDFSIVPFREAETEGTLSGSGRTEDGHNNRAHVTQLVEGLPADPHDHVRDEDCEDDQEPELLSPRRHDQFGGSSL